MIGNKWAKDGRKKFEVVPSYVVLLELQQFNMKHKWWSQDHHVIGGVRYARTADAARSQGWNDLANFIEAVEKFKE